MPESFEIYEESLKSENFFINDTSAKDQVAIDLTFDGVSRYERATKLIKLENRGTKAIDFSFEPSSALASCYFFQKIPFRLIPNEVIEIPFHFYPTALSHFGLLIEKWKLKYDSECDEKFAKINLIAFCKMKHAHDHNQMKKLDARISREAAHLKAKREANNIVDRSVLMCDCNKIEKI